MAGRSRTNVPATIYKDFQPQIERKEEQQANILIIHLPDFPKEQINVTYVDSSRSIKIQAERAVERNTISRFNQAFPVPENCIIEKIQCSYRNGVLTITMPKRTITQLPFESPKHVNVPKQTTPPKFNTPKSAAPAPAPASTSASTSAVEKQKYQKVQSPQSPPKPKTEPKPPMATAPQTAPSPKEQQTKTKVEALPPLKQQEETQRKVSPIAKRTEENTGGSTSTSTKPEVVEKKGETKVGLKDLVKEKTKVSIPESEAKIPKTSEKVSVEKKPKEGGGSGSGGFLEKAKEMKDMRTIMKTVKKLATDYQENRQLLINIGVSVLVIVALGAYITYSYRSSGKPKN